MHVNVPVEGLDLAEVPPELVMREEPSMPKCSCEDAGEPRKKREPSAYNRFIGACMKGKNIKGFSEAPVAMRTCSLEWKKLKGKA